MLVTPRRSTLASRLEPLLLHLTGTDADAAARLTAALDGTPGAAIVVDDAELLADTPLGNELAAWYRRIRDTGHRLLAAAAADSSFGLRGLVPELAKTKCGLVLEPASTTDGSVFGARLPASVFAPGVLLRGALIHHGRITAVQVPAWSDDPAGPLAGSQPSNAGAGGEHAKALGSRYMPARPWAAAPWARCSPGASSRRRAGGHQDTAT